MHYPTRAPHNFLGLENQPNNPLRHIAVLPVPYDATTSYKGGAREGPWAIIEASRQVELFDIELQSNASASMIIETLSELDPSSEGPAEVIRQVETVIKQIIAQNQFPLMLGGEHSISLGAVRALKRHCRQLSVLQIDAHTDLRASYEGSRYNHACIMRRVWDLGCRVSSIGIRSGMKEDLDFYKKKKAFVSYGNKSIPLASLLKSLHENVYITIDLDGFDPSFVPATGTPEPGGLSWEQVTTTLKKVCATKNVVGADIVELSPIPGQHASDFFAARLAYKIIGLLKK